MNVASVSPRFDPLPLGDEDGIRALVDQHKRLVFTLIARSVDSPARAEALTRDVFLRAYRGLADCGGEASLSAWIYRNVCAVIDDQAQADSAAVVSSDRQDRRAGADRAATAPGGSDVELRTRVGKAMARLPVTYQLLLNADRLDGLRDEDLADALQVPAATVKMHRYRARQRLRALLENEC